MKKETQTTTIQYKGWTIRLSKISGYYEIFSPEEMEQPAGSRYIDFETSTIEEAKRYIDNY